MIKVNITNEIMKRIIAIEEKKVCSMIKLCLNKVGSLDYISYLASLPAINEEDKPKLLHVSGGMIDD